MLLEAVTETASSVEIPADVNMPWWAWLLITAATIVAAFLGHKVGVKKAAKAAASVGLLALALTLSGCAAGIQKDAARESIRVLRPVIKDLEERAGATESERKANEKQLSTLEEAVK